MSEQLALVVRLTAKPGHEDELGRRLQVLAAPTRVEAGCINCDVHRSHADPAEWMIHENWRSPADLDVHFRMPYLERFLAERHEVLAHDMVIDRYGLQTATDPAPAA
ncbi:hypothetical protein ASG87_16910 [Frateuria sp. Soil773]|uniref:putative quinol monooxygenase n=1 Tax=Frateuria sp. Soil773 TaxID=1736407 RepID=UPI0006F461D3|nr:putative quinol monooxygenase [Frateuria sp. Soil773]KRE94960.1 hypothetical protein ASG87_16910 [Frateuria sp. Soil773]